MPFFTRAICALLLVALLGSTAGAASPRNDPEFVPWQRGGLSIVYKHVRLPLVSKVIAGQALPRKEWIDYPRWLVRSNGKVNEAARHFLTDQTITAYETLRKDERFAARYGHILPETWSPEAGRIEQILVKGRSWDALSPQARMRAGAYVRQVVELAQKALPDEQVDANRYNFVFDRSGKPVGWVDWVIGRVPAHLVAP